MCAILHLWPQVSEYFSNFKLWLLVHCTIAITEASLAWGEGNECLERKVIRRGSAKLENRLWLRFRLAEAAAAAAMKSERKTEIEKKKYI